MKFIKIKIYKKPLDINTLDITTIPTTTVTPSKPFTPLGLKRAINKCELTVCCICKKFMPNKRFHYCNINKDSIPEETAFHLNTDD